MKEMLKSVAAGIPPAGSHDVRLSHAPSPVGETLILPVGVFTRDHKVLYWSAELGGLEEPGFIVMVVKFWYL